MAIQFIPECAQGEEKTFEGKAIFRPMTIDEKYEMADELQKINDEQGKVKALLKGFDYVEPLLIECQFKNLELGVDFKTFKELRQDSRNDELCQELVAFVIQGFKVSKNLKA